MSQPSYFAPPHTTVTYLSSPHVPTVVRLAKDVAPDGMPAIFDETFSALVPALAEPASRSPDRPSRCTTACRARR